MHPRANPDVEALICRHGLTDANVQRANFGSRARLVGTGKKQNEALFNYLIDWGARVFICSDTDRTFMAIVEQRYPGILVMPTPLFNEWKRPEYTIGKSNDDPKVAEMLRYRRENFGPSYVPLDGEETYGELTERIEQALNYIRSVAQTSGETRLPVFTHGLFARMLFVRILLGVCDDELFPRLFRDSYSHTGFANAGIMSCWYGTEYDSNRKAWNVELACVEHLPPELRHAFNPD